MGFFDKLKMGSQEEPAQKEEVKQKKTDKEQSKKKDSSTGPGQEKKKTEKVKTKPQKKAAPETPQPVLKTEEKEEIEEEKKEEQPAKKIRKEESDFEGELAIDVYETDGYFVIQSTIAGVKAGDLDITVENDIITIKGSREKQVSEETNKYYYQECYWGAFSRQVILPEEVDGSKAEAVIKEGVLTLKIPKIAKVQKRKIAIKEEE